MPITIDGSINGLLDVPNLLLSGEEIIERDSNANGEYIRFGDGTQICWRYISPEDYPSVHNQVGSTYYWDVTGRYSSSSIRRSSPTATSFPSSFISLSAIGGSRSGHPAGHDSWITVASNSSSHWSFSIRSGVSQDNSNTNSFILFAVGRWF